MKLGGVQNHYSLIYRPSERSGILDWCRENDIPFFAYMVLEQGALSGSYNSKTPFPKLSRRGMAFNRKILGKLEPLHEAMRAVGEKHGLSVAETASAWAIAKGTVPIIGITKPQHAKALSRLVEAKLTEEEIASLEAAADKTGVEQRASWEPKI